MQTKIDTKQIDDLIKNIKRDVSSVKGVRAGVIGNQSYPNGEKVADVAIYNEYGTERIPPRPFLRNAMKQKDKWTKFVNDMWDITGESNNKLFNIAKKLGEIMVADIKRSIGSNIPPPNSKATIARKKSTKTLIDTGTLIGSIQNEVLYK